MALYYRSFHADRTNATLESLTDAQFRVWTRLYSYASEQPTRGTVVGQSQIRLAAAVARGDQALLAEALAVFTGLGLLTQSADDALAPPSLHIAGWAAAQTEYPSETPAGWRERKRRQRGRDRSAAVPINRDTPTGHESVTNYRDSHDDSHESVTNFRDSHDDSHESVTNYRDSHEYTAAVTTNRDTNGAGSLVQSIHDTLGVESATPYMTRAGLPAHEARAEYTGTLPEESRPDDPAASESLPANESRGEEKRARASLGSAEIRASAGAREAPGFDAPPAAPPVTEAGLAWWLDELESTQQSEGVDLPAEWATRDWLQHELEAMGDDYRRRNAPLRDWGAAARKWLRNTLRFKVRDLKAGRPRPLPGAGPPAGTLQPPPLVVVGPSDTARAAIGTQILADAIANMGARMRDGPGVAPAQARTRAYLAARPDLHALQLKSNLESLEKLQVARTLDELLSYAKVPHLTREEPTDDLVTPTRPAAVRAAAGPAEPDESDEREE